jgi:hypothetical protein
MPSADLYRRHAATCRRLASAYSNEEWTGRLISLANEYEAKAAEIEIGSRPMPDPPVSPDDPHSGGSSECVQRLKAESPGDQVAGVLHSVRQKTLASPG